MSKATITIEEDSFTGKVKAEIIFDPPLPPGEKNDEWLEKVPTTQLTGMLLMDHLLERLEGDYEAKVIEDDPHGPRH